MEITKKHRKTFGGDGCVHCLNCSEGFISIYRCQNSNHINTIHVGNFFYVNYTIIKLLKIKIR